MTSNNHRFSERHGLQPITAVTELMREDAPKELRDFVINELDFFGPTKALEIVCTTLRQVPDPYVERNSLPTRFRDRLREDVISRIYNCAWYEVYDLLEAIYAAKGTWLPVGFLNELFIKLRLAWKFENGQVQFRGDESLDALTQGTKATLIENGFRTTAQEIHESVQDLSRRPQPDLTGALHHSIAAIECIARQVTGNSKSTLGKILNDNPDLIPKPLDIAVEKMWGFASEHGRHRQEGHEPELKDVELVVAVAAAVSNYLTRSFAQKTN